MVGFNKVNVTGDPSKIHPVVPVARQSVMLAIVVYLDNQMVDAIIDPIGNFKLERSKSAFMGPNLFAV